MNLAPQDLRHFARLIGALDPWLADQTHSDTG